MTTKHKPDGGPAYPHGGNDIQSAVSGMTLRDAAILAVLPAVITTCANDTTEPNESLPEMFVRKAGYIADAMIAERDEK